MTKKRDPVLDPPPPSITDPVDEPEYPFDSKVVVAILETRGQKDPFLAEVVRAAKLEAALLEATKDDDDAP